MRRLTVAAALLIWPVTLHAQDHSAHGQMDHSQHAMEPAEPEPSEQTATPRPQQSGPISAADAIWGAQAMAPSREALYEDHGNMLIGWFQADRLELRSGVGGGASGDSDGFLWDVQAYYGGDLDKLWLKSEGEGEFGEGVEDAEIQALYSRAIAPFFDLQAGVRQDLTAGGRTHLVLGVQGLAPYEFELDAALFVSTKGDVTARIEAELDQRLTQRLILQPRAELELAAQGIRAVGTGRGISSAEAGLRLRYEIVPEFAPYLGVEYETKLGRSRDFARIAGEDPDGLALVAGVRFWF